MYVNSISLLVEQPVFQDHTVFRNSSLDLTCKNQSSYDELIQADVRLLAA